MLIDLSIDLCICLFIDLSSYLFSDLVIFLSPDQSGALSIYWSILLLIHCSIDVSNFLFHRSSFVIINSSINLPIASSICRSIYRMMTHDTHIHSDTYMYVFSIGTSSFDIKNNFPYFDSELSDWLAPYDLELACSAVYTEPIFDWKMVSHIQLRQFIGMFMHKWLRKNIQVVWMKTNRSS